MVKGLIELGSKNGTHMSLFWFLSLNSDSEDPVEGAKSEAGCGEKINSAVGPPRAARDRPGANKNSEHVAQNSFPKTDVFLSVVGHEVFLLPLVPFGLAK